MDDMSSRTFMSKRHSYESTAMNPGTIVSRAQLAPQVLLWADSLRGFPAENNNNNNNGNLKIKSNKKSLETLSKSEQNVRKVGGLVDHSPCTDEEEEEEEDDKEEEEQEEASSSEEEELLQYSADRRRGGSRSQDSEIQHARKLLKILNLERMISDEDVFERPHADDLLVGGPHAYNGFQLKPRRQAAACKKTQRSAAAAAYQPAISKKFDLANGDICGSDTDDVEEDAEEGTGRAADSKEDVDSSAIPPLWTIPRSSPAMAAAEVQTNKAGIINPFLLPDSKPSDQQQFEAEKDQTRKDVTISQWRYKPLATATSSFTKNIDNQLMSTVKHFRSKVALPNITSQQQQQQQQHQNNNQLLDMIKTDTTTCQAFQQEKELLQQQDQDHYKDLSNKDPMMINKRKSSESAHHHTVSLQGEIQTLRDSLEQQCRQIGILTKSNSKLLLRIETLEKEIKLLTSIHFISSTLSPS